jgi:nicotinate phosphoribosyltransferase
VDAPYLDIAYKLVRYGGRDVLKLSTGKKTWVGEKQVYRRRDAAGRFAGDVLALREEPLSAGDAEALLTTVMDRGRLAGAHPALTLIRDRCARQVAALPADVCRGAAPYPVVYGERLLAHQRTAEEATTALAP